MSAIARFIVHRSRVVLALTGVITLVALGMLFRMSFNADVSSFLLEGNEVGEEFAALQEKYDARDPINVVASLPEGETFATPANLALLAGLRDELVSVEGVESVAAVVPEINPLTGQPIDVAMIESLPEAAISQLLTQSPVADLLLSEDGRHALIIVTPGDDATAAARAVTDVEHEGLDLVFSGNPVIFSTVLGLLGWFILIIPPVVIALLIGTFYATIGDRRLSLLAIVPAILGSVWTFGLIFGLGNEVDIVTVIVPIFVIVMGSADGLHFVSHFQDEAEGGGTSIDRVTSALRHVGVPMILTTISTAAGFLSLLVTDVEPIRQLGLFSAIGITFAGIISFFSLPALLSRLDVRPSHHKALLGPRVTAGIKRLVRNRVPALVIILLVVAFAAVAIPQLEVSSDQLFFFKDDDPVRQAFEQTEELFGGATPLVGEFVFDPDDVEGSIEAIRETSGELRDLPGIRVVFSPADLVDSLGMEAVAGLDSDDLVLPLGDMVSSDGMRFMLLPAEFTTADVATWLDFVDSNDQVRTLTGMTVVWDEIARLVLRAQATSLLVAYALLTLLLLVSYRRVRETLVALVPITLTVAVLLGFIAVSGIQLNLLTAVISSIVLGVGIDYAIHYIAAIDNARGDGPGYVFRAIDRAGRPIAANALGIAIALTALWLSPLKIHSQVSMIMWVSMITAGLSTLVVVPALLPREGVDQEQKLTSPVLHT
jgi:predicted RND superfamily exporter protein